MNIKSEAFFEPCVGLPNYGLKAGDRITVTKGSGCISVEPDWVEVVEELPQMILCKYIYKHWMGHITSYNRCLNKIFIVTGDISIQKEKSQCIAAQ